MKQHRWPGKPATDVSPPQLQKGRCLDRRVPGRMAFVRHECARVDDVPLEVLQRSRASP
jgi:hypothetical protein